MIKQANFNKICRQTARGERSANEMSAESKHAELCEAHPFEHF